MHWFSAQSPRAAPGCYLLEYSGRELEASSGREGDLMMTGKWQDDDWKQFVGKIERIDHKAERAKARLETEKAKAEAEAKIGGRHFRLSVCVSAFPA
jgi:hypothetical protein